MSGYSTRDIGINPNLCNASPETARNFGAIRNVLEQIQDDIDVISDVADEVGGYENLTELLTNISLSGGLQVINFALTANLSGGSATATVASHNGTNPTSPVTVYDPSGLFSKALSGAKGIAYYNRGNSRWEVLISQQQCLLARANINAALCGESTASVAIYAFEASTHTLFSQNPSPLPTTAYNNYKHRGKTGDEVMLAYDKTDDRWVIIDIAKRGKKVTVGDYRISGGYLQAERATCAVEYCADPEWENLLEVDDCS